MFRQGQYYRYKLQVGTYSTINMLYRWIKTVQRLKYKLNTLHVSRSSSVLYLQQQSQNLLAYKKIRIFLHITAKRKFSFWT